MTLDPSHNLTALDLSLIGSVVLWWSGCEQFIFDEVMLARPVPCIAASGTAWPIQISTGRLITQWRKVAEILKAEFSIIGFDLDSIEGRLRRLSETRNLLVHGFYDLDSSTKAPTVSLLRWDQDLGTFINEPFFVTTSALLDLRKQMNCLYDELYLWSEESHVSMLAKPTRPEWPDVLSLAPKPIGAY